MLAASLVERCLKADGGRAPPQHTTSRSQQGTSKLSYVKKEDLPRVRQQCAAYRTFQQNLKQWRQLMVSLESLWKQLQQAQSP